MELHEFLEHLRNAAEDDANLIVDGAHTKAQPTMPTELQELFNCILDMRSGEAGAAEIEDETNIEAVKKLRGY